MNLSPQRFIFTAGETWQFRRAQSVAEPLAQAVRRMCEANRAIRACYLLDTRRKEGGDLKLTIALSLDHEAKEMDSAVVQLQEVLRKFPEVAGNTVVMLAKRFQQDYAGAEFYVRRHNSKRSVLGWLGRRK